MPSTRSGLATALIQRAVVVELARLVALLVGVSTLGIAVDAVVDPYFRDSDTTLLLLRSAVVLAGMGVVTTVYAAWRGYTLPVSRPDLTDAQLIAAAVAGTVALALLPFLGYLAPRAGVDAAIVASTFSNLGGVFSTRRLIRLALFVPGMVVLAHGLVQGALQHVFGAGRDRAVVVTTLLCGYLAAPTVPTYGTFPNGPWLFLWGNRAAMAILFVAALGVAVYADGRLDRRTNLLARLAVLGILALAVVAATGSASEVLVVVTRMAVIGVAAYTYDRTASLVTPTLVYATFAVVSSVLYTATVTAVLSG